jgi:hypothetical protein
MSETKFTPGPWRVCNGYGRVWIDAPDTKYSERDRDYTRIILGGDDYEDAHLIAAAPELYEAVVRMVAWAEDWHEGKTHPYDDWQFAKAALAKARGEA